jgi:pimeloyl-ACP methyl ester carboxylesterase
MRRAASGHHVVAAYAMQTRIDRVRQPALLLCATADPFASPQAEVLYAHLHDAPIVDIPGGGVSLPDQLPEAFARVVGAFLRRDPD